MIPPVDVEPGSVQDELFKRLQFAKQDEASQALLAAGRFAKVVRMLDGSATSAAQLNNLGCGYAGVAAAAGEPDLWMKAGSALRASAEAAAGDDAAKQRADDNLTIVAELSGGLLLVADEALGAEAPDDDSTHDNAKSPA